MAEGLVKIAAEAGASPIKCPHCRRKINNDKALWRFFELILERIRSGEEVVIKNFGSFRPLHVEKRKLPKGFGKKKSEKRLVVGFRNSRNAKAFLNEGV